MKYKTLFRLVLKAIGVWLFFSCACQAIGQSLWLIDVFVLQAQGIQIGTWGMLGNAASFLGQAVAGLYLFFGGEWIVNRAIPGNRPYCPECGYDLTGKTSERCPECGTTSPN